VGRPVDGACRCSNYEDDGFVARYAAVWAYGVTGPRMGEDYYQRLIALGIEAVSDMNSPHIIDVGCGPGRLTADLARRIPSALCTAIDPAGAMIDLARRNPASPSGNAHCCRRQKLWFPSRQH
jgi:SAM-dependent methyltransferase